MDDNRIEIVASLDYKVSEASIVGDLQKIQDKFNNKGGLQIKCQISDTDLKNIQTQLSNITRGLNVDVGTTGVNAVQQSMQQTASAVNNANQQVQQLSNSLADLKSKYSKPIEAVLDNQGFVKASETMQRLKEQLADLGTVSVQGIYGDNNGVNKLEKMIATIKSAQGELRTLTFELGDNDLFRFVSGKFDNEGIRKQTEEVSKFIDTYTTKLNSLKAKVGENFAPNISATLGEDINKATVTFDSFEQKLVELGKGNGSIEELRAEFVALDGAVKNLGSLLRGGDSSLNQFTNATINARNFDKELKSLEVDYEKLSVTSKELTFDSMANAQQKLLDLQRTQDSEGYTEKWIRQYQEVSVAVKQVAEDIKLAKKLEQQDTSSDVQKQLSALKEIADAYKKIREYSKTTLSVTATDEEKANAQNYLNQYEQIVKTTIERLAEEKLLTAELAQQIQAYDNIRIESDNVTNARAVGIETARAEAEAERQAAEQTRQHNQELKDTENYINKAITALEKFNNSATTKRNSNNADVISQTGTNANLVSQLKTLSDSLGADKSAANIQRIKQEIDRLAPSIEKATADSQNLVRVLTDNRLSQDATKRLNNLTNQINTFANANKKAIESTRQMRSGVTFADEWKRITDTLKAGNLDDNAIRQLTADFQNFKGEARSVGNVTNTVFTNMSGQIQMLASRWLSLYAVIAKLKTMVNYVIELDDAMTKLKRVTDETAEGYERFLKIADQSAKETNTTLVDAVEQAARFAKMGYSATESAKLAKTSLIYSVVGDIDNETAVNDLVTALKGFRLEAENAMSVVDKLDALNNKYATDAKSLGEALTVSASAMSAAGNDIDQTLAMITGATEITQNAKETAQALRTITMRLRGMKGELQELGEETEGVESISKIQTQILNYTKGKVNIFDKNNQFKETYQILEQIADVYNELSQTDQAALTEVIFGKLRANQGLAVISAFQSGQIQKALNDSRNAAGTATEEMERYGESITAHLNQFKEAVQKLSSDWIESGLVKTVIDDATVFVKDLDLIVNDFKELREIVPQVLKDITNYINGSESLLNGENTFVSNLINPIKGMTNLIEKGHDLRTELFGADADTLLVENVPEATEKIDSLTKRYLELYAAGESNASMSVQLGDIQDNLNDKYMDASKSVDILNKSLSENLAIAEQLKREEVGKWLDENTEKYEKAAKELEKVSKVQTDAYGKLKGAGDAYTLNATGLGRYTKSQYEAFANLGLSNYYSAQGTGLGFDFALSGTLQDQLDSLIKIRDVYSTLEDQDEDRLRQMNTEIDSLKDKIYQNEQLNSVLKEQQQLYNSLQAGGQKYNMLEQAKIAYDEYQKALDEGDSTAATNALTMLNTVKDTLYSVTEPTDLVRQRFNELWDTFSFGTTEAVSAIDDVKQRFSELSGDEFDKTLKNITTIEGAIESLMGDELLSHEDAWKLINLDTDGILTDIQIIGDKYKLNTDQMLQLLQQQTDKQKESILETKAQAEQELKLLEISKARLKVNSQADVAHYLAQVAEIEANMKSMQGIIDKSDYLLMELNGQLSVTSKLADATAKSLSNAVKNFEAEIEAIDNTIDSLNERKEILEEEKSELQEQLNLLNEQKSVLEETLKNYDTVANAVEHYVNKQADGIQKQIDALEEERKAIEDYYDKQIDALQKENDERDLAIRKEKALADLANAQNQKKRVYSSARGWTYESDKEAVANAQNALNEVVNDEKIQALEKEREKKLTGFDERKTAYEKQIAAYEEYAKQYTSIASDIQEAEAELLADQILGSDWREKIEKKDEELLTNYRNQYTSFNAQLQTLVNTEIKALQDSIDKKDEEIKKIDDEIKAYNKYKSTVQKALKDAESALKDYQSAMETAKTNVITASNEMENKVYNNAVKMQQWMDDVEHNAWENSGKIQQWYNDIGSAAERLRNKLSESATGYGIINSAGDARLLRGYSNGGVANYTGLALLHGTSNKAETIFNANDSAKLYDLVHNTPNLIASMAQQSFQTFSKLPTINSNSNTSSINVSIGQIVANNPQELTRNLDKTLDSYFRQKLTQSYVQ